MTDSNVKIDTRSYYTVLGVPTTASESEIRKAYKKLAMKLHPDKSKSNDTAELFKIVVHAHSVLSNKTTRAEYDKDILGSSSYDNYRNNSQYSDEAVKEKRKQERTRTFNFERHSKPYEQQPYGFGVPVPERPMEAEEKDNNEIHQGNEKKTKGSNKNTEKATHFDDVSKNEFQTNNKKMNDHQNNDSTTNKSPILEDANEDSDINSKDYDIGFKRKPPNRTDLDADEVSSKKKKVEPKSRPFQDSETRRYMKNKLKMGRKTTPPLNQFSELHIGNGWEKLQNILNDIDHNAETENGMVDEEMIERDVKEKLSNLKFDSETTSDAPKAKKIKTSKNVTNNDPYNMSSIDRSLHNISQNTSRPPPSNFRPHFKENKPSQMKAILDIIGQKIPMVPNLRSLSNQSAQYSAAIAYLNELALIKTNILSIISSGTGEEYNIKIQDNPSEYILMKTLDIRLTEKLIEIQKKEQEVATYFSTTSLR